VQKHTWRNTQNDCHQWLSDSSRMHQICFRPGLCPGPRWGSLRRSPRRSPRPLSRLRRGKPPPHSPPPRCLRHLATRRDAFGISYPTPSASASLFPHFQKSGYAAAIMRNVYVNNGQVIWHYAASLQTCYFLFGEGGGGGRSLIGSAMVPLDRALLSSYRLSIVIPPSLAVWPQFAMQILTMGSVFQMSSSVETGAPV